MPCYEGPRPQDVERDRLMAGAFPALLCGLYRGEECEDSYARQWCDAHYLVDAELAKGKAYSSLAYELQRKCDDILIAYNLTRGAVQPCAHDEDGRGWCRKCGFRPTDYPGNK